MTLRDVHIVGAGMTAFRKSGASLKQLAAEAVGDALGDAGADAGAIEAAYVANAVGGLVTGQEMIPGQVALAPLGVAGVPVFNVENACASASTALHLGWQAVACEQQDVVLCLGVERLTHPIDKQVGLRAIETAIDLEARAELERAAGTDGAAERSFFMDLYASWTRRYMERSGATARDFAAVAVKNQAHGALNPLAQYGGDVSVDDVLATREIVAPLTLLMCAGIADGAAAVVLASASAMRRLGARGPRIRASVALSGRSHDEADPSASASGRAAARAYASAGVGPDELDCVELHDATAAAELMIYEELALAAPGEGPRLLASGDTRLGGRLPVNPSGGLLCRGHPIGATGLAQVCELTWQLRGDAGTRQVPGARVALAQNDGGWIQDDAAAACVHVLTRD